MTLFGLFLTPVFYVTLRRLSGRSLATARLSNPRFPLLTKPHPWRAAMSEIPNLCRHAGAMPVWRALRPCWQAAPSAPISRTPEAASGRRTVCAQAEPSAVLKQASPETGSDAAFWRQFQDAQLTQLVEQALQANQDLRALRWRGSDGPGPAARKPS